MNLAALWQLPVLFCCENNLYAMGTALARSESQTDMALKAAGYAIAAWAVDGMDVLAVEEAARRAVDAVAAGAGPHFLELRTYRFRAHSMFDPELYRDKAEVERWMERDPIDTARARPGRRRGSSRTKDWRRIQQRRRRRSARPPWRSPRPARWEPVEDLTRVRLQRTDGPAVKTTYREAMRAAIREALQRDDRVFLMGEDVGRYGGCFAVSLGLLEEFGPERIRDTPLSESGVRGRGHRRGAGRHAARSSRS